MRRNSPKKKGRIKTNKIHPVSLEEKREKIMREKIEKKHIT